jgi:hypothetical protein
LIIKTLRDWATWTRYVLGSVPGQIDFWPGHWFQIIAIQNANSDRNSRALRRRLECSLSCWELLCV